MTNPGIPSIEESCRFLSDPRLDGRAPGTEGHEEARRYLEMILPQLGFEPLFPESWGQPIIDGQNRIGTNLGGIRRGKSSRCILLGAHYDHLIGIPGADDNAAAVSILIETFRRMEVWDGDHSLVLCFFDLEEPPYFLSSNMGSVYFVEHSPLDLREITCALIFDLCGHDVPAPGLEDAYFVLGAECSTGLVELVSGHREYPVYMFRNDRVGDMSDHHAFRERGVPFLFFSCGRWSHYHQPSDRFENLNLAKMSNLATYLVELVQAMDGSTVSWSPVKEFWRVEAASLSRLTGMPLPRSERDVDVAIDKMKAAYGL